MRTRSPARSDSTSASLSGVASSLTPSAAVLTMDALLRGRHGVRVAGERLPAARSGRAPLGDGWSEHGRGQRPRQAPHAAPAAHSVTSLCRWAWHSIRSEGGVPPPPHPPPPPSPPTTPPPH